MRLHTLILAAGQQLSYDFVGTFVKVMAATGDFTLRVEDRKKCRILSDSLEVDVGVKLRFPLFDLVRVTDTSGAANTIELLVGEGDHDSDAVLGTVSVDNTAAETIDSQADVTLVNGTTHDIAADPAVRVVILQGDPANTADLRIRDQAAATDEGMRLAPGEKVFLALRGALRVTNNTGANQTFSKTFLKD